MTVACIIAGCERCSGETGPSEACLKIWILRPRTQASCQRQADFCLNRASFPKVQVRNNAIRAIGLISSGFEARCREARSKIYLQLGTPDSEPPGQNRLEILRRLFTKSLHYGSATSAKKHKEFSAY
jgi:hypothetical protein